MLLERHLKGREREEWTLMCKEERNVMSVEIAELRERIEPVNPVIAVQKFRHLMHANTESLSE